MNVDMKHTDSSLKSDSDKNGMSIYSKSLGNKSSKSNYTKMPEKKIHQPILPKHIISTNSIISKY